jgi:hypothetical protein
MLSEDYAREIKVPRRTAKAQFMAKGRYVPRRRLGAVPVRHINVDAVTITARRIPEPNLVFWLSGQDEKMDDRTSDPVAVKTFPVENKPDAERTSWLDLSSLAPADGSGVFEFTAGGGAKPDSIRVVLTRLSLVAKRSGAEGNELYVWALDSESLKPESVAMDVVKQSGLRMNPLCGAGRELEAKVFTALPVTALKWVSGLGVKSSAPPDLHPDCQAASNSNLAARILSPRANTFFFIKPGLKPEKQEILVEAEAAAGAGPLSWFVDGRFWLSADPGERLWLPPSPGPHEIKVLDQLGKGDSVRIDIIAPG